MQPEIKSVTVAIYVPERLEIAGFGVSTAMPGPFHIIEVFGVTEVAIKLIEQF